MHFSQDPILLDSFNFFNTSFSFASPAAKSGYAFLLHFVFTSAKVEVDLYFSKPP